MGWSCFTLWTSVPSCQHTLHWDISQKLKTAMFYQHLPVPTIWGSVPATMCARPERSWFFGEPVRACGWRKDHTGKCVRAGKMKGGTMQKWKWFVTLPPKTLMELTHWSSCFDASVQLFKNTLSVGPVLRSEIHWVVNALEVHILCSLVCQGVPQKLSDFSKG